MHLSKDAVGSDPSVDSTAIIADLESFAADGLHEVQIFSTARTISNAISTGDNSAWNALL